MSNWSKSNPLGTEQISNGATRVREMKLALQEALDDEHYFPNSLNMVHKWPYGSEIVGHDGRWRYNPSTYQIERYDGSSWAGIAAPANLLPSGTKMLFFQASAPTGWTQDTSFGDDELLRVIGSGPISGGGGWAPSSNSCGNHNHTPLATANVTLVHVTTSYYIDIVGGYKNTVISVGNHNLTHYHVVLEAAAHAHAVSASWRPAYLDVIVATKN
jgi:hypothetical protein